MNDETIQTLIIVSGSLLSIGLIGGIYFMRDYFYQSGKYALLRTQNEIIAKREQSKAVALLEKKS